MDLWKSIFQFDRLDRLKRFVGLGDVEKDDTAVRIGVVGAAKVATYALIWPAKRRSDVVVAAVAARDPGRAAEYAKQNGIPRVCSTYEELINDPSLDVIYVALPTGLHGDITKAALKAGKHVLCEKPFTANSSEAREVQKLARRKGLLCREAFHYKEHPLAQAVREQLTRGELGTLRHIAVRLLVPGWAFDSADIRFSPKLAGGAMMDAGCYCAHALRFFPGQQPRVLGAWPRKLQEDWFIDREMKAAVEYPGRELTGALHASLVHKGLFPVNEVKVIGSKGTLEVRGFMMPSLGHIIRTTCRDSSGKQQVAEARVYGNGESTYFYQLERFVGDVRAMQGKDSSRSRKDMRRVMQDDAEDAIGNMQLIDDIYKAAALPLRVPTGQWKGLPPPPPPLPEYDPTAQGLAVCE